ncbi:MAG TPA: hypothetical protein DEF45_06210 [Rhodopirellula sp.]|nr:hypothetical protein [Rhodopirellula sp.]
MQGKRLVECSFLKLQAVEKFGIPTQLAKPSTYIRNKGEVVLSYLGNRPQRRRSLKALLGVLRSLREKAKLSWSLLG